MMISALDTPYGAALIHFWQLFTRRPLNLPRLQEAFASLGMLAIKEQPTRPWPTTLRTDNGQSIPFTIEALLARRSELYASSPAVPASTVQELLTRWTGATIKEVLAGWQGAGFQVRLAKRVQLEPNKARPHYAGSLLVACTWQLVAEQQVVCSSNDTDAHMAAALLALKGRAITASKLSADGQLLLYWQAGSWLAIQPDKLAISADYHLDFGWDDQLALLYTCFEGAFVTVKQENYNEPDNVAIL
jgi:hypothetical protein